MFLNLSQNSIKILNMRFFLVGICLFFYSFAYGQHNSLLIEAESFQDKGGWLVDPQFVEQMGSPYLLAHGIGKPVNDARTSFQIKTTGNYNVWVRTKNWAEGDWNAPGRFSVKLNNYTFPEDLGTQKGWSWQFVGRRTLKKGKHHISLIDLTGFDGRCDAIYISSSDAHPPSEKGELAIWRLGLQQLPKVPENREKFDLVVVGGGLAGCAAAIAAAEEGLEVALIHDRPVLGGNASGEIRVHTLGIYGHYERILRMIDTEHYPNGSPKAYGEDEKRMKNVSSYKNIHLYLNWRAFDAHADNNVIQYVDARHTSTAEQIRFEAPLFVDSTGDGWIGFWTGASFNYGRESVDTFHESWDKHGELWSPEKADDFVMGSSVLWRSEKLNSPTSFPEVPWAMEVANEHAAANGEWQWEFSRNDLNQIEDAEEIRDHMLKAIYGSFFNEKQKPKNDSLSLKWVSYLVGKRESRRLIGDHIFTFLDAKNSVKFPDSVVVEEREIDVHFQQNLLDPNKPDFLSEALFYRTDRYYVPYRSLYSKNIKNLFMAGRCFSCSHIGLGGPRVMRTTGQMGAAVGYAASLCKRYNVFPRDIYEKHLKEYMNLVMASDVKK
jgi:hypothetical protein